LSCNYKGVSTGYKYITGRGAGSDGEEENENEEQRDIPGMLRVLEPKKGKEWGMKRIERIRKSVGRGIGEEIDGLMRRKGGTEGRMWQRCGGSGGGCGGYVGVCVCGLQISARESGTPHTKNLRHSTKRELLAAVSPFAIVSYLANN